MCCRNCDCKWFVNYGLYGLNGCPKRNLEDASVRLVRIFAGVSLSVGIGCLHPENFRNYVREIREIRSKFADGKIDSRNPAKISKKVRFWLNF